MPRKYVLFGVLCISAAVGVGHASLSALQQSEPTFKGNNRTVAVYATVRSAEGRLVPDLQRDAFIVRDEGKPQELTLFSNELQPITVVMLLDRSGSMRLNFELVERAAGQFVDAMLPTDKARIGSFSNRIQLDPSDFTSDREELHRILRTELQEEGPTPLWNAVNVGITSLLHQQGRRVILVFTDGADDPMNIRTNNSSLKSVMKRAEEEDVMVYAIGLVGDDAPGPGRRRGMGGRGGRMGPGGSGGPGGFGGPPRGRTRTTKPDEGLPKIAAATGGGYFELTSAADLASTFKSVADELHHQYALGFTPTVLDGKMHALDVRLANGTLSARARKSYLARTEQ